MTTPTLLEGLRAACAAAVRADRLAPRRAEAAAFLARKELPTARDEEWRFTDLSRIAGLAFEMPRDGVPASGVPASGGNEILLVFADGFFRPELSRLEGLPPGCIAGSLTRLLEEDGAAASIIAERAGAILPPTADAFAAANTALHADGAFLRLPRGARFDRPIRLFHLSGVARAAAASFPRTLVVAEPGCEATVVEEYLHLASGTPAPVLGVTEALIGEGARIEWIRLQNGLGESRHVSAYRARLAASASLAVHTFTLDSRFVRNTASAVLEGAAAECTMNGLYVAGRGELVDNHTAIEHRAPRCPSHELYKGILHGDGRGVFNGKIFVTPEAQGTDAKQTNRNLLLSDDARVNTKPQLEIYADDVKCTHGATVGQLDDEALFYLKSRALPDAEARRILTQGFADEMIERVGVEDVKARLEALSARLLAGAMEAAS